jgi:Xaa-Pro aminopeptidase
MSVAGTSDLFAGNRRRLIDKLHGGIVVFSGHLPMQRSNDIVAPFEQEANFWWASGIDSPHWWLIIDGARGKSWLVSSMPHVPSTAWDALTESVIVKSGVDGVLTQDSGMQMLRELSKKHSIVHTIHERPRSDLQSYVLNPAPRRMYELLDRIFINVQDCRRELVQLRIVKQPEEIIRLKKAARVTVEGFNYAKTHVKEAKYEYEIEAALAYHFRKHGAKGTAYSPIVAGGVNATSLAYMSNDTKLRRREAILVDAGIRLDGYATSVARTYVNGESTRRQSAIHEALLDVRHQIMELLVPNMSLDQYQRETDSIMRDMLMRLGLLEEVNDTVGYRRYFPHSMSHGIGVDVHESLGSAHFFMPGMTVTVEPGVYIPEEKIGMRLGDTVLITSSGHLNLSGSLSTDL